MHRDGCTCRIYTIKSNTPHTHSHASVERVGMCDKLWCISFFVCDSSYFDIEEFKESTVKDVLLLWCLLGGVGRAQDRDV